MGIFGGKRFAPLLEENATLEEPSHVIVTASLAGLVVGTLGENATFGYSASKGPSSFLLPFSSLLLTLLLFFFFYSSSLLLPSPYQSIINPTPIKTAAAIHLTRNLAVELGPRHILCNSIAPGFIPSKMASGLIAKNGGEEALAAANPNGRLGRPEDVAATVVFLASRASSHVNGACVVVDGGRRWAGGRL